MKRNSRNTAIDVMKFIAALMITNSHMGGMYAHFSGLATGGAIGDALFFFCSGFTLFLGQERRFDNWYKRRIRRIYPTIIMWAIMTAFLIDDSYTVRDCIVSGGGWFVSCIMVYYILIFFVRKIFKRRLWCAMGVFSAITIAYYYITDSHLLINFYGEGSFRLVFFFLIMLFGAIVGQKHQSVRIRYPLIGFLLLVVAFYGILSFKNRLSGDWASLLNLLTILCLGGMCITLYSFCNSPSMERIMSKRLGWIIKFIGGLCLEIYVVQHAIITTSLNGLFPLNLLIIFVGIVLAAYLLRCLSRFFLQTFKKEDYDWKEIVKPL